MQWNMTTAKPGSSFNIKGSLALLVFALVMVCGCSEFIEPSIDSKQVVLNAPGEGFETNKYQQTFWWDKLEGARKYRLQVVSPSFASVGELILDTLTDQQQVRFTLDPGTYQWRVRAENAAGTTAYTVRNLIVHESSIDAQRVQIISPAVNLITNQAGMVFKWYSLFGSLRYRLQIDTSNFADENNLLVDTSVPGTEYSLNLSDDRRYQWRVRAENAETESLWTPIQSFKFDRTPPGKVQLSNPPANAVLSSPVQLAWNIVSDASKYQLFLYKNNQSSPFSPEYPLTLAETSYTFRNGKSGDMIYWKVRAIDEAGNVGQESELRSFTIQ